MAPTITSQHLEDHVRRLGDEHPPIAIDSVDFTVVNPAAVRDRFGTTLDYLARVELEVARNVKELGVILPSAPPVDVAFYRGVWADQELQHGRILDRLKAELGLAPARPLTTVGTSVRLLGVAARLAPIADVARFVYYLTGASTERQAVLAYSALIERFDELGERALASTLVRPIKRQEPGHFAFYQMSATKLAGELAPWQLFLARQLRSRTYDLVGTNRDSRHRAELGEAARVLGWGADPVWYAAQIGRFEARLLWAGSEGMAFPPYVLAAIEEARRLAAPDADERLTTAA